MIELLKSIGSSIVSFFKWFVNFLNMWAQSSKVVLKLYVFATEFIYLIPGFLVSFCMLFMVIYIVNRILNGRN